MLKSTWIFVVVYDTELDIFFRWIKIYFKISTEIDPSVPEIFVDFGWIFHATTPLSSCDSKTNPTVVLIKIVHIFDQVLAPMTLLAYDSLSSLNFESSSLLSAKHLCSVSLRMQERFCRCFSWKNIKTTSLKVHNLKIDWLTAKWVWKTPSPVSLRFSRKRGPVINPVSSAVCGHSQFGIEGNRTWTKKFPSTCNSSMNAFSFPSTLHWIMAHACELEIK